MKYNGINPNSVNYIGSGSLGVFVENTNVATFGVNTLTVTGSTSLTGSLALTGSASTSSAALLVYKSGSTVVDVQGSSGQLFSITDSLTGSLFTVNTIAGLPVMEAFSDNTVNIGKFGTYPIKVVSAGTLASITGSFTGSLTGTATTASYVNPLNQNVNINGNLTITGSATNSLLVKGSTTSSVSSSLLIQNSAASASLVVLDNGYVGIGTGSAQFNLDVNGTGRFTGQLNTANISGTQISVSGYSYAAAYAPTGTGTTNQILGATTGTTNGVGFYAFGATNSTNNHNFVLISRTFNPTTGTGYYTDLAITPTLNQTGTATGIIRGIYYNPVVTSVLGIHTAFESTAGRIVIGGPVSASSALAQGASFSQTLIASASNDTLIGLDISSSFNTGSFTGVNRYSLRTNSDALISGSLTVLNGITGSFSGSLTGTATTASYVATSSYVPTLNQVVNSGNTTTGSITVGSITTTGSYTAVSALAQGSYFNNTLSASANNDVLVGVDINPTFTNGAFTGVSNIALRAITNINNTFVGYELRNNNTGNAAIAGLNIYNDQAAGAFSIQAIGSGYASSGMLQASSARFRASSGLTNGFYFGTGTTSPIVLFTNDVERLRIFGSTGNISINTSTDAGYKLDVNGTGRFSGNLTITGSATNSLLVKGSGTTSATNTFVLQNSAATNLLTVRDDGFFNVSGSGNFQNNLTVSGSSLVTGSLALIGPQSITGSLKITGSAGTGSAFQVYKSGSTVVSIQGSQGELFSITDSLSGSLFSVSNISGLPIVETFSDNTTLIGNYLAPMLITTQKLTVNSGSTVVYSLPTASYDGAFFDYTLRSGSNARAGQIMSIWSGSTVNFTDNSTTEFGSTSGFVFGVVVSGSNMVLTGSASTSGWTLKTIIRSI